MQKSKLYTLPLGEFTGARSSNSPSWKGT